MYCNAAREYRAKATGDLHTKFRADRSSGSTDMLADRQTHTHTDKLVAILPLPRVD